MSAIVSSLLTPMEMLLDYLGSKFSLPLPCPHILPFGNFFCLFPLSLITSITWIPIHVFPPVPMQHNSSNYCDYCICSAAFVPLSAEIYHRGTPAVFTFNLMFQC